MKKIIFILLVIICHYTAFSLDTESYKTTHHTTDNLRLREKATTTSLIVTTLNKGTAVQVLETGVIQTVDGISAPWVKVLSETGYTGWCFSGYLAEDFSLPPVIDLSQHIDIAGQANDFRIWGWSKNGKVAFSYTHAYLGTGGTNVGFYIMDMINNNIVYEYFRGLNVRGGSNYEPGTTPEDVYHIEQETLLNTMEEYEIELFQSKFVPFPIQKNNAEYTCFTKIEYFDKDDFYGTHVKQYIMIGKNGSNRIMEMIEEQTWYPEIFVLGCFISPFENRALIVTTQHYVELDVNYPDEVHLDWTYQHDRFIALNMEEAFAPAVVGETYKTIDNLRMRNSAGTNGTIITAIQKGNAVMVLEIGKTETIENIEAAWTKVRISDGQEGWVFGGYLETLPRAKGVVKVLEGDVFGGRLEILPE